MIYKLKVWTIFDETTEKGVFKDLYFDVEQITGFYIPEATEENNEDCINILFNGDMITIKQEDHITSYLTKEFVDNAVCKQKG